MKKQFLFIVAIIFFTINANSQIEKGNWMVGGNGSYSYSTNYTLGRNIGTTNVSLLPDCGYFIFNKFVIGADVSWNYAHYHDPGLSIPNSSTSSLLTGPFARYYVLKADNRINFFGQAQYQHYLYRSNGSTIIDNSNYAVFSIGSSVFLNSSVGFELAANYKIGSLQGQTEKQVLINIGFQIFLETEKNYDKHH